MTRPGEVIPAAGRLTINEGRVVKTVRVRNGSERVVYVTSHYHFFEANRALVFDRGAAYGMRLDVAAGTGVRWAAGETRDVGLVALAGRREVHGFNGLVNGPLDEVGVDEALARLRAAGFGDAPGLARATAPEIGK